MNCDGTTKRLGHSLARYPQKLRFRRLSRKGRLRQLAPGSVMSLIQRAAGGDVGAFTELVSSYRNLVFGYAAATLRP